MKAEDRARYKVGFVSLGCPKNQTDTEVMLASLAAAGYAITPDETEADAVVINTCGFIESAKQESIDNILDIAWLKTNAKLKALIVAGCLAERYRTQIRQEMPEVDAVIGKGSMHEVVEAVDRALCKEPYESFGDKNAAPLGGDRILTQEPSTVYLKIAEGCDNRCTYCAIPDICGHYRSRPMEELVKEAKDMESLGAKELILVAQDTTRYGEDLYGKRMLPELLQKITAATTIPWIRVYYCYPEAISDELIAELRDNPRIVKYVDMPIQHISDRILKRMNRRGGKASILSAITRLRAAMPDITLRTTLICGFPGETEEDFEELCAFVRDTKFQRLGVFAYSREEDTPAYDFPDQIDEQVKQDRCDLLMQEQMEIHAAYNAEKLGKTLTVLCEGYDPVSEAFYGRSEADAPEIDGKIYFTAKKRKKAGMFVPVKIREVLDYDLIGEAEEPQDADGGTV